MRRALLLGALGALTAIPVVLPPPGPTTAAPIDDVVAVVVEGQGNGHGRGLSQWGSYGWAVEGGWTWQQILGFYYGGTSISSVAPTDFRGVAEGRMTVRLVALDDAQTAVVSFAGAAEWSGAPGRSFAALVAREVPGFQRLYQVWGSTAAACPAPGDALAAPTWELLGQATGATADPIVRFTTPGGDDPATPAANLLGVCEPAGTVRHYRGSIYAANGTDTENRTVNDVRIEDYLRGVVPRESPASWGDAGGGAGANALRAQAVAARSYALAEGSTGTSGRRYSYAKTCDTQSCQVYGGAGLRGGVTGVLQLLEDTRTDAAVAVTAAVVIRSGDGTIPYAEFSSSNGGRSAGGRFPSVVDYGDAVAANPWFRWTRVISASQLVSRYGLGGAVRNAGVAPDAGLLSQGFVAEWAQQVVLTGASGTLNVPALSFRSAFGLPSSAFTLRVITRGRVSPVAFAMIGDSVGESITTGTPPELPTLLDGIYPAVRFDAVGGRCTVGATCLGGDGLAAVAALPFSPHTVLVELGYNDWPPDLPREIDQLMSALVAKGAKRVVWVNLSERRLSSGTPTFAAANQALLAARARWPQLVVLDWNAASITSAADRWFSDGVHLTTTGQAQFALWLRDQLAFVGDELPKITRSTPLRLKVTGRDGVPSSGVSAVSLNVTVTEPSAAGFVTVYPCAGGRPWASNLNYVRGQTVPNAVVAPVDANGEVCFYADADTHLVVDVNGWFAAGFSGMTPVRWVDTRVGSGAPAGKVARSSPVRVSVLGRDGVPSSGVSAVSLNVTVTEPSAAGFVTVYPCAGGRPWASNLNYVRGQTVPNAVVAPVDANGEVCFYADADTHLVVDVNGWFAASETGGFSGMTPVRWADTRIGLGWATS